METQPTLGPDDVLAHIVTDAAKAVSVRPGESQQQQFVRAQAAARSIMEFQPGDAIEAIIAGQCVMLHEMIVDSVRRSMRGEEDAKLRASRGSVVAMDKAFGANLIWLERRQTRNAAAAPDAERVELQTETDIADRVRRHQSRANPPEVRNQASAGQPPPPAPDDAGAMLPWPSPVSTTQDTPTPGQHTDEATPALVASQMPGPNRKARRAMDRQARKRHVPATANPAMPQRVRHHASP